MPRFLSKSNLSFTFPWLVGRGDVALLFFGGTTHHLTGKEPSLGGHVLEKNLQSVQGLLTFTCKPKKVRMVGILSMSSVSACRPWQAFVLGPELIGHFDGAEKWVKGSVRHGEGVG